MLSESTRSGHDRFSLHLITDRRRTRRLPSDETGHFSLLQGVQVALQNGVDWVQVREKTAPASDVLALTQSILQFIEAVPSEHSPGVLVNDRLDVALAAGAHGVHLAKKSLPPAAARPFTPARFLVGVSVHSKEEAQIAEAAGADYITFGHIFPTASKQGLPPRGLQALRRVVESVDIPVLAIGGITPQRLPGVLETGCAGIAVIGSVLDSEDPGAATRAIRQALDASPARPRHPFPSPSAPARAETP